MPSSVQSRVIGPLNVAKPHDSINITALFGLDIELQQNIN